MNAHRKRHSADRGGTGRDIRHDRVRRGVRRRGRRALGRDGRVEAVTATGFAVQQAGLDRDQGRGRRAARSAGAGQARRRRTRFRGGERARRPAPCVDRAVLRLRRRDAPQSGGDVSGRRTVHPLLRRRRAGAGAIRPRHRGGQLPLASCNPRSAGVGGMTGHLPSGTVTFLLTDLEGSTRMWEQDPDAMKAAMVRHDEILEKTIAAHRGFVFSRMGDGMAAAFATARDAVSAAAAFQQALATEDVGHRTSTAGPRRAAHRRGGDRRRHRLREPADQSVLPTDDSRARRADGGVRCHRNADARSAARRYGTRRSR